MPQIFMGRLKKRINSHRLEICDLLIKRRKYVKMGVSGLWLHIRSSKGRPDNGVNPGTAFENLPEDWVCPSCGANKDLFDKLD